MEEKLKRLLEGAKKSKKALRSLKLTAIAANELGLAAELRDLERELFPDTPEDKFTKDINITLRMVGINPDPKSCYLIGKAIQAFTKSKGKFSIEQASDIQADADRIFGE